MNITWYGQTCFRINSQKNRNGVVNILFDPLDKETGFRGPKLEADILLITHNNNKTLLGDFFSINGPGEYDIKEIYIRGFPSQTKAEQENTIYAIEAEGIRICHLGKLGQKELSSGLLEDIGEVDILMIPVGAGEAINAGEAVKIMAQIEPKIIIPMYYRIPKLKVKLDGLDEFLKALGIKKVEVLPKLSIKEKNISKTEVKIIVLKP